MTIDRKAVVISAIKHEETALCPYTFGWDDERIAERLDRHYGSDNWRSQIRSYVAPCASADDGRHANEPGPKMRQDVYGSIWRADLRPFHLEEPVLKRPSLQGYQFPDPDLLFPDGWEQRARATIAEHSDCFTTARIGFGLFERSWGLRGFEQVLIDAVDEPNFFADLIAAIAAHQSQLLDRVLQLPIDGMMFSDDWGDQHGVIIGPDRWREVIKPHAAGLYAKARSAGKFVLTHCCGSIADIIPDVVEIGLDVLESVQPEARGMDPYQLKDRFGDELTFWGGLGSQSIIPFGTPDQLRGEIKKLAAHMRKGGGYILACAKDLQPETPTENAAAIVEEFIALGEGNGSGQ